MYRNLYEKRGFPFKKFLLKFILVIFLCFLSTHLLWVVSQPLVITNKEKLLELFPSYVSKKFINNLDEMKKSVISYYTVENLPKNMGESNTMSLKNMIDQKLIADLIDKNNKFCDEEKSYVKVTKLENGFLLKVNLKDSETNDYILTYLDFYTYCDSYVCERKLD